MFNSWFLVPDLSKRKDINMNSLTIKFGIDIFTDFKKWVAKWRIGKLLVCKNFKLHPQEHCTHFPAPACVAMHENVWRQ